MIAGELRNKIDKIWDIDGASLRIWDPQMRCTTWF